MAVFTWCVVCLAPPFLSSFYAVLAPRLSLTTPSGSYGSLRTIFAVQVFRVPTNLSKNFSCSLAVVTVRLPSGSASSVVSSFHFCLFLVPRLLRVVVEISDRLGHTNRACQTCNRQNFVNTFLAFSCNRQINSDLFGMLFHQQLFVSLCERKRYDNII